MIEVYATRQTWNQVIPPPKHIVLFEGVRKHRFGRNLTTVEREWIIRELNAFVGSD